MKKSICSFLFAFVMLTSCGNKTSSFGYEAKEADMAIATNAPPPPPPKGVVENGAPVTEASGNNEEDKKADEPAPTDDPAPADQVMNSGERIKIPEKIKKTADINITVDDYKKARAAIEKIVRSGNTYIGSENEQNSTYSISNTMVIRVMNKDFDAMINNVTGIASNVNSKNITAEDVTAQFVDIQSRLNSKREIEKRYLDILQKASKVTDILEIQQKLGEIREEIEAKEGQLKYLADQVDYSTINLTFHQEFEYTPTDKPGFFGRLGSAFGNGWSGFLSFLVGVVYAWPLWIILGVIAYVLVKFIKRQLKK